MMTADEIRARILDVVLKNGGHLASSLGAVELSMALAEVFDPETDRVIWDVGHQAYAWKLLTGRDAAFDTLRQLDGISPFTSPLESKADAAIAGHAGSALSVALGQAAARDLKGTHEHVIAVIGDASIVNGHSFEALNNCAAATEKVIVILNDNGMAISKPTGSFSRFLGRLITGVRYNRVKAAAEAAGHKLHLTFLRDAYHAVESRIKGLFLGNRFFEAFGLRYIGPVDGHDLKALTAALTVAKEDKRSVIVHVVTKKGKGYAPAEKDPTAFHGVGPGTVPRCVSREQPSEATQPKAAGNSDAVSVGLETPRAGTHRGTVKISWSAAFGQSLAALARQDARIVALTAAMPSGTGLEDFAKEFPKRFYDVGITEGHMVSFAAGLAAQGMRPVVAVYSTFLQRAIDQVIHDVAIAKLPVIFCVDRAGVVGADGKTHQGLYDIALLRTIPNLTIAQPKDAADLKALLEEALVREGPTVIRYPRGKTVPRSVPARGVVTAGLETPRAGTHRGTELRCGTSFAVWATGDWLAKAEAVAKRVGGVAVQARYLKPFDAKLLAEQRAAGMTVVSLENGAVAGGFGEAIGADVKFGWPDEFIPHGTPAELEKRYGLDVDAIVAKLTSPS